MCEDIGVWVVQDLLKLFFCHFTVGWREGREGAYNVTHTNNTLYTVYIHNMPAMSTVANTKLVNTTQLLLSETSAAQKLLNPPPFQPIKHRALCTTHNPYVRMVCPPQ